MSSNKTKPLSPEDRDTELLRFCKRGLNVADMCRKSGSPNEGLTVLRSVFPLLVRAVYCRWSTTKAQRRYVSTQSMLASLLSAGRLDNRTYARLREVTIGLTEHATGSDARFLIDACRLLLTLSAADEICGARDVVVAEDVTEPHRPSLARRFATAALVVVTFGLVRGA